MAELTWHGRKSRTSFDGDSQVDIFMRFIDFQMKYAELSATLGHKRGRNFTQGL